MNPNPLVVDGVELWVEGEGAHTVVMIHGWPDTHRLWDGQVAHLLAAFPGQLRCVRFTLPGFDLAKPARALGLQGLVDTFARIVDTVSPGQPVTLMLHDWGCVFGYEYLAQHPQRVARLVAVDIGDHNSGALVRSLSAKAKMGVFAYQAWLAMAWAVGRWLNGKLGDAMTRRMAELMRCPVPPHAMGWQMNYPYWVQWTRAMGGYHHAAPVAPQCPTLYTYGKRKPFQFQSPRWLEKMASGDGNQVQALSAGHWVMVDQPVAFNQMVTDWLSTQLPLGKP